MSGHDFHSLFHLDKKGALVQWDVRVESNDSFSEIVITHGGADSDNKIESRTKIDKGKNIGKKNQTTHHEQAMREALSRWKKKRDLEGYRESVLELNRDTRYFPMLAHDYLKHKDRLKFPCFIQPKLDGYRMIYHDGKCLSRQNKEFAIIKNTELFRELTSIDENLVLDGELYLHGGSFEKLGVLRKKSPTGQDFKNLEDIEYHVYDLIQEEKTFRERRAHLEKIIGRGGFKKIKYVQTESIQHEQDIQTWHSFFIKNQYEGSILRNSDGFYRCRYRSTDLLKHKDFMDDEFPIIDYTHEIDTSGDGSHLIVWVCKTKEGNEFSVRPKGSHIERKKLFQECQSGHFEGYKGRMLWVKFFELTDRNVPRFPTTKTDSFSSYMRDPVF